MNAALTTAIYANLSITVQIIVCIFRFNRIGRGRILSRPLWRFRFFAPKIGYTMLIPTWTRLMQLAVLTPTTIATSILVSQRLACIGWVLLALLYVDDWLTGDDEEWGRFKKWLKRRRLQLAFGGAR